MIFDDNEEMRYNVTNQMRNLTLSDEKSHSRYDTPDQPPSYETLFATPSTPSSSSPIATRSTIVQPPNTSFLPCVVPRKPPLAITLNKHRLTLFRNLQALRQRLRQPLHPRLPTIPPNPQHNPNRLPGVPRRPQPSLHLAPAPPKRQRRRLNHANVPRHAHSAVCRHGRTTRLGPGFSCDLVRTHKSLLAGL